MGKTTERAEQETVIHWARMSTGRWPCLRWLYHTPNGAHLSGNAQARARQMNALKAQGLVPGVPDLCLPFPSGEFHGLYIEMKKQGGEVRETQWDFIAYAESVGYLAIVCYGAEEAIHAIECYLLGKKP